MTELADLEFLVDELFLESDTPRGQECATQIYLHAYRGADLAPYLDRLRAGSFADQVVSRHVGRALAVWAYLGDDAELVRDLLEGPHALATLQLDHRTRVGPGVIREIVRYTESVDGENRHHAFRALGNLARCGADLGPAVAVLVSELATPAKGRGYKRFDLGGTARWLLKHVASEGSLVPQVLTELSRVAEGTGKLASAARDLRAEIQRGVAP